MMKIMDGQVHVWQAESADRPWPQGGAARAQLPYALTCERLLTMMNEAGVDRAILVPPSWEGDRNDHALAGAAAHPDRFAVMGRLALNQPGNAKLLRDWKKQPGMLGVRLTFVLEREREWMRNGITDWFWVRHPFPRRRRFGLIRTRSGSWAAVWRNASAGRCDRRFPREAQMLSAISRTAGRHRSSRSRQA